MNIPLQGKAGALAIVDEGDDDLARFRWFLNKRGYVCRNLLSGEPGFPGMVLLHREILGLTKGDGLQVDHKNRDRLDNRKVNLRIADNALNRQNMPSWGKTSRFRGVSYDRSRGRWVAACRVAGTHRSRRCLTEEEAAKTAAEWRRESMPYSDEAAS